MLMELGWCDKLFYLVHTCPTVGKSGQLRASKQMLISCSC